MSYFAVPMPTPAVEPLTAAFWDGCQAGELRIAACGECGRHHHPPAVLCPTCRSPKRVHSVSAGRGVVFSYTVAHHAVHPTLADAVPYHIAVVKLDDCDGVLLTTNVVDLDQPLAIGMAVELAWEIQEPDDFRLPRFRRRTS